MITKGLRPKNAILILALVLTGLMPLSAAAAGKKDGLDLGQIFSHMNESSKHLKTLSARINYTTVTVIVDDHSTQTGQMYFRNAKSPDILIDFSKPVRKVVLVKNDKAEIYNPMTNQITERDLSKHSQVVQQFFLLGFGGGSKEMQKVYDVKYLREEQLGGDMAVVLELTPRERNVAALLSKVQLWVSEESWLPIQQKFFQPDGDYSIARYSSVKVNRRIPSSTFQIHAAKGAKRVVVP